MWRLLNPRLWMILGLMVLVIGGLWKTYNVGYESGENAVKQKWDQEKAELLAAQTAELMKAQQQASALQALANRLRKEKINEANRIAAQWAADVDRMRDRPEARAGVTGVPQGSAAGVGCTGAGLSAVDARLLVGISAVSAGLQSAYDECRQKYTALERQLNGE